MGAWGTGSFENEDALSWLESFKASGQTALVDTLTDTLDIAARESHLEASDSCMALAAAEVVAALRGQPSRQLPEDVHEALKHQREALLAVGGLKEKAMEAVQAVLAASELKELWEEGRTADDKKLLDQWLLSVTDLLARLD